MAESKRVCISRFFHTSTCADSWKWDSWKRSLKSLLRNNLVLSTAVIMWICQRRDIRKLTFRALALRRSDSTQLIKPNYLVILPTDAAPQFPLETYPPILLRNIFLSFDNSAQLFSSYSYFQEKDNFQEHLIQMASKSDIYRTHLERLHIVSYNLCYGRLCHKLTRLLAGVN